MRVAATLGRVGDNWILVGRAGANVDEQKDNFARIKTADGQHQAHSFEELIIVSTDGLIKRAKFAPKPAKSVAKSAFAPQAFKP